MDGSDPTADSFLYTDPINITQTTTIKAIAVKSGMNDSSILTAVYTFSGEQPPVGTVAVPSANPQGGTFDESVTVTLFSSTDHAIIYYTLNGIEPTSGSALYTGEITIYETTTLKAFAVKDGMNNSDFLTETYTINEPEVVKSFIVTTDDELKDAITEVNAKKGVYDITVIGSLTMEPSSLISGSQLTLKGAETEGSITLTGTGSLFTVQPGNSLILENNITLYGHDVNTASLVRVAGTLTMKDGSKISGNANTTPYGNGGGVSVNGTFVMEGGEISGCSAEGSGGGVSLRREYINWTYTDGGTFTMKGGKITGNTAKSNNYGGGGVSVCGYSVFILEEGEISGNTASSGGGVYTAFESGVYNRELSFVMKNGKISCNEAVFSGGGVYARYSFTMEDGEISGNITGLEYEEGYAREGSGGGVFCYGFFMNGGKISNNKVYAMTGGGGGVYVDSGSLSIDGGEISNNNVERGRQGDDNWGSSDVHAGGGIFMNGNSHNLILINARINNNTATSGGGVFFANKGSDNWRDFIFTMEDSEISGNTGGGVLLSIYPGTITMKRSKISDNIILPPVSGYSTGDLRTSGILINGGSDTVFIMEEGSEISGNTSLDTSQTSSTAVSLRGGTTFIMKSGTVISNNTGGSEPFINGGITISGSGVTFIHEENTEISNNGGCGIVLINGAQFTMQSGLKISGNDGGVYLDNNYYTGSSSFTMKAGSKINNNGVGVIAGGSFIMETGAEISNNDIGVEVTGENAVMEGGIIKNNSKHGVYIHGRGRFTIKGGEITDNGSSSTNGGGVYVDTLTLTNSHYPGNFEMYGGTLSGNNGALGKDLYIAASNFYLGEAAQIGSNASNEVYLDIRVLFWVTAVPTITINSSLTGAYPVARFTSDHFDTFTGYQLVIDGTAEDISKLVLDNPAYRLDSDGFVRTNP